MFKKRMPPVVLSLAGMVQAQVLPKAPLEVAQAFVPEVKRRLPAC